MQVHVQGAGGPFRRRDAGFAFGVWDISDGEFLSMERSLEG